MIPMHVSGTYVLGICLGACVRGNMPGTCLGGCVSGSGHVSGTNVLGTCLGACVRGHMPGTCLGGYVLGSGHMSGTHVLGTCLGARVRGHMSGRICIRIGTRVWDTCLGMCQVAPHVSWDTTLDRNKLFPQRCNIIRKVVL